MNTKLRAAYTYLEFGAVLVGSLPLTALSAFRHRHDPVPRMAGRWVRRLGRASGRLVPSWKFSIEGAPPADIAHRGYVVVANHESQADPILLSSLPWDMRWVAKAEIFRVPFAGWVIGLGGDIPIRRGDKASVEEMMHACRETLRHGLSVMIFPEGTRSRDGALLPFKAGAFELAMESGSPILPVALAGTRRCRPKGSFWFGEAEAIAKVLSPIDPRDFRGPNAVAELRDATRAAIVAGVHELERRLGFQPVPPNAQTAAPTYTPAPSPLAPQTRHPAVV